MDVLQNIFSKVPSVEEIKQTLERQHFPNYVYVIIYSLSIPNYQLALLLPVGQ